jgi:hypothetical protein
VQHCATPSKQGPTQPTHAAGSDSQMQRGPAGRLQARSRNALCIWAGTHQMCVVVGPHDAAAHHGDGVHQLLPSSKVLQCGRGEAWGFVVQAFVVSARAAHVRLPAPFVNALHCRHWKERGPLPITMNRQLEYGCCSYCCRCCCWWFWCHTLLLLLQTPQRQISTLTCSVYFSPPSVSSVQARSFWFGDTSRLSTWGRVVVNVGSAGLWDDGASVGRR